MRKNDLIQLINANPKPPCLSVYLNFKNEDPSTAEILATFNSLIHKEIQKDPSLKKKDFKSQFDQLRKVVHSLRLPKGNFRGISIFTDNTGKDIQSFFLCKPQEILKVSSSFYLSPLIREFYETITFCFCLVDDRKARLIVLSPVEVLTEIKIDDQTPEKVKSAGWYGLEEKKISRHIEEHIRTHFNQVKSKILELLELHSFDMLVLSINSKSSQIFKKMLENLSAIKIMEKSVEISASVETIKTIAQEIELIELEKNKLAIKERFEKELAEGRAVAGLEAFLRAWNEGLVEKVLIKENFEISAFLCSSCLQYQLEAGNCSLCGAKVREVNYFIDELVKECFIKKKEVVWLKDFSPALGAILRTYLF